MSSKKKVRIVENLMPNFYKDAIEEIECAREKLLEMKDRSVGVIMKRALDTCGRILTISASTDGDEFDVESVEVTSRIEELDVIIEFIWEQLNTGHWKQVSEVWRKLYSYASLFKVILLLGGDAPTSEAIKVCDLGLLLGAPILGNVLSKVAFRLHLSQSGVLEVEGVEESKDGESHLIGESSFLGKTKPDSILKNQFPSRFHVGEVLRPSIETFVQDYFLPQKPVLLRGVIDHWSAMQKWNVEYIKKRAGSRTIPIEVGSKYTSEEWTQKLVTMEDFIDNYVLASSVAERSKGYLAQHQLFLQIPELLQDLGIPEYCYVGNEEDIEINAWFGPVGTVSPTHYDPKHNLLAQIFGEKIIRLYPPSEWNKLYPHDAESMLFNTSQVDVEEPNFSAEFPNSVMAKYADIVLEPGTVLYMPPKWAHFVKSLSPSFSVSYWFQ